MLVVCWSKREKRKEGKNASCVERKCEDVADCIENGVKKTMINAPGRSSRHTNRCIRPCAECLERDEFSYSSQFFSPKLTYLHTRL